MLRELQDNMKCKNICIIGIPEGEEQGTENLFEKVMMENFPNLMREKSHKSRKHKEEELKEAHWRHIIIKMAKFQDKENLKGSKGETGSNIQGSPNKANK